MADEAVDFDTPLVRSSDDTLRAALRVAEFPALLPALAMATGDRGLIPTDLRPSLTGMMDTTAGLDRDQRATARRLAFNALAAIRDGAVSRRRPDEGLVRDVLAFVTGDDDHVDDYLELLEDELNLGRDSRRPNWTLDEVAPGRRFRVVVIGAGMSGLVAAHRLSQAGLDVTVLEKNSDVGGTWLENRYPGCRVDVSNLLYSYSFAQRDDWPEYFSSQPVLLDYFRSVATTTGVRDRIRFDTEVTDATFDEGRCTWTLRTVDGDGREARFDAEAVVSAVGQLNRPSIPDLPGASTFAGNQFHSARWNADVDLEGRHVAVIGSGASAAQLIPEVARRAAHLTVLQRTPAWFVPAASYTDHIRPEIHWLRRNVPGYTHWSRFWVFWGSVEGGRAMASVDPTWEGDGRSVSAGNDAVRRMLSAYLHHQFEDRPDLVDKVIPDYPPFSKRFILDDGSWARALKQPNVSLVTEPIAGIEADGVRSTDGRLHRAEVLIFGTGFRAAEFLTPMCVTGRGGADLHHRWNGDARAHLGVTLPGFPNFFMLYGPNTNIVVNGSIIFFSECATQYVVGCIRHLLDTGAGALDTRTEAHDASNERVDEGNRAMAWGVASVNTWYRNAAGRISQNWPFSLLDYWQRTRAPEPTDFELIRVADADHEASPTR